MNLNIPTEKAIEILEKRKSEINSYDFEPKVWKDKTENDLREIFDEFDTKWMQISQLSFTTPFSDMKFDVLEKGKKQATQYLDAYIEQIIEYTSIETSATDESEKYYESENKILKKQISESISSANYILDERNGILTELNEKNNEIKNLKENTVQLSKITINKLFGLLKNLPISQLITLLGSLFAVIGFAFYFGTLIQEKSNMDNEFELREKLNEYKDQKQILETNIKDLQSLNNKYKDSIVGFKTIKTNNTSKIKVVIFNTLDKAISIKFENISKNNSKVKSFGTSVLPNSFSTILLDKYNYKWKAHKFINYKKNAITEKDTYKTDIIRINKNDDVKTIRIK